jgi:lipopolysaccharide biosynthesis glycosyltransferase
MNDAVLTTLADKNFIQQAKQLFSSVFHNSGWKGDYLLLSHEISKPDLEWFVDHGIEIFECQPLMEKNIGRWPPTVLSKFYLFSEHFKKWKNIIYLDGDVTVEASLGELVHRTGFNAVPDMHQIPIIEQFITNRKLSKDPDNKRLFQRLKNEHETNGLSFNCGIFSFSSSLIRNDTFQVFIDLIKEYRRIVRFPEQAILNLHFSKQWARIPIVYNNYYTRIRYPWRLGTEPFDGICNHFINGKPWIVKDRYFYPKWKRNLQMADSIDLNKRKDATRTWSEEEISRMSKKIDDLMVNRKLMTKVGNSVMMEVERSMGIGGRVIRKLSPDLYSKIKGTGYFGDEP